MLHKTIRSDDFYRNTTLQCCNHSKQFCNNVRCRCQSSHVTSSQDTAQILCDSFPGKRESTLAFPAR